MPIVKKIFIGITGKNIAEIKEKIGDAKKFKVKDIALFLEFIENKKDRIKIYNYLGAAGFKNIPLVHIRDEMNIDELRLIRNKFKTKYFTIHEHSFDVIQKWKGFYKNLYLEMNKDNFISKKVNVEKIGGFCVDFSHFKAAEEAWAKEFEYTIKKNKNLFKCNHLNGYSYLKNSDLHTVQSIKDFDYLKTLPEFIFSKIIALELFNNVSEQIIFKKYLTTTIDKNINQ